MGLSEGLLIAVITGIFGLILAVSNNGANAKLSKQQKESDALSARYAAIEAENEANRQKLAMENDANRQRLESDMNKMAVKLEKLSAELDEWKCKYYGILEQHTALKADFADLKVRFEANERDMEVLRENLKKARPILAKRESI